MATFNELPEKDRVQAVKDAFVLILEDIVETPDTLTKYLDGPENQELRQKILTLIGTIGKKVGCVCNRCFDVSIYNSSIPNELFCLIDQARKLAETRLY